MVEFGSSTELVIDLHNLTKDGTTTKFNPAHVYIIGVWTYGGGDGVQFSEVFLSNDGKAPIPPTALPNITSPKRQSGIFNLRGQYMGTTDTLDRLSHGIYIVDGKKVVR